MTRDLEALRTEHRNLRAAADAACREAQAAQETAKFAYSQRLGPCVDAVRRAARAWDAWMAADDAASRARRAVIEAEDEIAAGEVA